MFKKKLESLSAIKGKEASEITDAEISAINDELKSEGIGLVAYRGSDPRYAQADVDQAVANATAESATKISDLTNQVATLKSDIATKDTEITSLKAQAQPDLEKAKAEDTAHEERSEKKTSVFAGLEAEAKNRSAAAHKARTAKI